MSQHADKTEQATPQRQKKAREEGQLPQARELVGAAQVVLLLALVGAYGGVWVRAAGRAFHQVLSLAFQPTLTPNTLWRISWLLAQWLLVPALLLGAAVAAMTMALHLASTGLGVSGKLLTPDVGRLNPWSRLKELPGQNLEAALRALVVLATLTVVAGSAGLVWVGQFRLLPVVPLGSGVASVAIAMNDVLWKGAWVLVGVGALDAVRQRWKYQQRLRMSKQEIKDEIRENEGRPEVKARLRQMRRELTRRKMMKQVETATAVLMNPTHYAVALRYDPESSAAPLVVGKGKNYLALQIKQKALDLQIPLIENPPLARALYQGAEVGQEIPPHLYRAVAEVLAYVYRVMNQRR